MRTLILLAAVVAATACQKENSDIDIPTAQTRAALALSAFDCSHLAAEQADASRLFAVGLAAGRDFLTFSEQNPTGYRSIAGQVDPIWESVAARPSVDFKLGEIHAASSARARAYRGRWNDDEWARRRDELYQQKNCAFVGSPPAPK